MSETYYINWQRLETRGRELRARVRLTTKEKNELAAIEGLLKRRCKNDGTQN